MQHRGSSANSLAFRIKDICYLALAFRKSILVYDIKALFYQESKESGTVSWQISSGSPIRVIDAHFAIFPKETCSQVHQLITR